MRNLTEQQKLEHLKEIAANKPSLWRDEFKAIEATGIGEFVGLRDIDVDDFRRKYPNFVPDGPSFIPHRRSWWDMQFQSLTEYPLRKTPYWEISQGLLRQVWGRFPCDQIDLMKVLLTIVDTDVFLAGSWKELGLKTVKEISDNVITTKMWGDIRNVQRKAEYFTAVMWLSSRGKSAAKICADPECRRPFLAGKPKQIVCSVGKCKKGRRNLKRRENYAAEHSTKFRKPRVHVATEKEMTKPTQTSSSQSSEPV